MQHTTDFEDIQKAKNMGRELVTHPPDWKIMDQQSTDQWWSQLMQGKIWYVTDPKSSQLFKSEKSTLVCERDGVKKMVLSSKL